MNGLRFARYFLAILCLGMIGTGWVRGSVADFEQANKLYEEGRFLESAAAYQAIIDRGDATSTLYFNLGNAYYKANRYGRAIAAYRLGQRLDPRDPSLRFNLQFARQHVTGQESPPGSFWQRALTGLTMNEWTTLACVLYWIWLGLLCLREARQDWRRILSGYTAATGAATLILTICLVGAWQAWFGVRTGVVVARETLVRYGPLEESQVNFALRDGSEFEVLDHKEGAQTWLRIRDASSREGWLKADDVVIPHLPPAPSTKS